LIKILPAAVAVGLCLFGAGLSGQDVTGSARVTLSSNGRPLADALVSSGFYSVRTDSTGVARLALAEGLHRLVATKVGFSPGATVVKVTKGEELQVTLSLAPTAIGLTAVTVTSARTEQSVEDVPVRVQVLAGEDIEEKNAIRPGDLRQIVAEIPGIWVQPGVAGSSGTRARIQGFRGQYTQYLTDGLPLSGATDEGLSVVQLPPLDLSQVEVIKTGAAALYGLSALGGVVNFVSRQPQSGERASEELLLSSSSLAERDAVSFSMGPLTDHTGYTLLASGHASGRRDPDRDGWIDDGASQRFGLRPRFFWSNGAGSHGLITTGYSFDHRVSGTVDQPPPTVSPFRDSLSTRATDAGAVLHLVASPRLAVNGRGSIQGLTRDRIMGGVHERDGMHSAFVEASADIDAQGASFVGGAALSTERFRDRGASGFDYRFTTASLFAQVGSTGVPLGYSASVRCDRHSRYGVACAPLFAFLLRPAEGVSLRLSGASGARAPSPFTDESAITGLSRIKPFSGPISNRLFFERGRQLTFDAGFQRESFQLNATAYITEITRPVGLRDLPSGNFAQEFVAAGHPTRMRGLEVFGTFNRGPFSTTPFVEAMRATEQALDVAGSVRRNVPLTPHIRAGLDVAADLEDSGTRVAVETYFTGAQTVEEDPYRTRTIPYTTIEALLTQKFPHGQFFLTAENLTNVVQTSFDPLLLPSASRSGRRTTDVWAPLSGRVWRTGAKLTF